MSAREHVVAYALIVAVAALSGSGARAQTPIKIIMPAPAGGAGDIVARMLTEQVGRAHHLVSSPGVIVVNSASPYRTLGDFLGAARAKPGELTFAAVGPGTVQHIGFEMLKRAANVNLTFVPYTGGAPAITALLGGHVTAVFAEYAPLAEHIKAGRLRPIAATTGKRIDALPELPTVGETYNDYEVDFWWGLFAPAKTPRETVSHYADWFTAAIRSPEVKAKLAAQGFIPVGACGADFAVLLRKQYDHYGRVIREANMKAE